MTEQFDLIISLCCYKSPANTLCLLKSAEKIRGSILFYVTTILEDDTRIICNWLAENKLRHAVKVIQSYKDCRYFCQNWGFVDAWKNNTRSVFWGTMDDDTAFVDGWDFIEKLYEADQVGFSVIGFSSNSHPYWGYGGYGEIGKYKNLHFVDGHNMFSHFADNLRCGLCDQYGVGNTSFVEVEYTNRLRDMTQRPILGQQDRIFIDHLFRRDPLTNSVRVPLQNRDIENGVQLYKRKYGIDIAPNDIEHFHWEDVIVQMRAVPVEQRLKHLVFNGIGTDWEKIYDTFSGDFHDQAFYA